MKTTLTIISIIVIIVALLFVANTEIQLSPFKIKFERPYLPIGLVLIFIGSTLVILQYYNDGRLEGYKRGVEDMRKAAQELIKNIEDEKTNTIQ